MGEFVRHLNGQMIPVNKSVSYFSVIPMEGPDLQRLIYDPAAAAPPKLLEILRDLRIILVGYLEKPRKGSEAEGPLMAFQAPAEARRLYSASYEHEGAEYVFLAVKDGDIADSHDTLYDELSALLVEHAGDEFLRPFHDLLREELGEQVRGELEERGWKLKEQLLRRQADATRDTKLFRAYADQALIDTLSLYFHGLCCDIDVDAGPLQLPSRTIRRRLETLRDMLSPPAGVALFPEELKQPL
ncbi:MAG: hypothetical protein GC160_28085 [Acidobacteria bacterium]|nr:hypothetical protein [Acidobacteriota bacterium]